MIFIYTCFIISFYILILSFSLNFLNYSFKNTQKNKEKIQLFLFFISILIIIIVYYICHNKENYIIKSNSLFNKNFIIILLSFYFIFFISSIYKHISTKELKNIEFKLKKDEYKITNNLNFKLSSLLYTPNIKSYALAKNKVFIFSRSTPEENKNLKLFCYNIGDNVYHCFSYVIENDKNHLKYYKNYFINILLYVSILFFPVLLIIIDCYIIKNKSTENFKPLFIANIMMIFGTIIHNTFKNNNSFFTKTILILSYIIIITAILYFIKYFIQLGG